MEYGPKPAHILLISYHFGPRGGTGARRWNAISKHLAARGWSMDVLTATGSETGSSDLRLCRSSNPIRVMRLAPPAWRRVSGGFVSVRSSPPPPGILTVSRDSGARPGGSRRGSYAELRAGPARHWGSLRRFLTELAWSWTAVRAGCRLAAAHRYRAVVVSTPPHPTQLAGAVLGRILGIPYVADYRDPWVFGPRWEASPVHAIQRAVARICERWTMERADRVVCNTELAAEAVKRAYPGVSSMVVSIPNGYDRLREVSRPDPTRFRVVYAGHLYPWHDLGSLLAGCARFLQRSGLNKAKFRVELMGVEPIHRGVRLEQLARSEGLERCLVLHQPAAHDEAMQLQQAAALLVVFDHFHGLAVPAKFYDCAQMYGTLLLLGDRNGALAAAGRKIGVPACSAQDPGSIDRVFDMAFDRWRAGEFDRPSDGAGIFDRLHQTSRMCRLLDSVVGLQRDRRALR